MNNLMKRFDAHQLHKSELIIEYLENMALNGYKLSKIKKYYWYYEKITPTNLKYDIYYSNEPAELDKWEFITNYNKINFYSSQEQDACSIVNNEKNKFEIINKNMKNDYILFFTVFFFTILTLLILTLNFTLDNPLDASGSSLPLLIISLLLMLINISIPLISFYKWYFISKKNISQEKNCYISKKQNPFYKIFVFFSITIIAIFTFLTCFTILNNAKISENSEPILKKLDFYNGVSRDIELHLHDIPLTLQDLGFDESEYYSYQNIKSANSLFLNYNLYKQSKLHLELGEEEYNLIHIDYNVIDIKFAPMLDWILNSSIDLSKLNNYKKYHYVLKEHDTLDKFYQMYQGDTNVGNYVMCKDNKIVTIEFYSYIPTDEQLNIVIETLF